MHDQNESKDRRSIPSLNPIIDRKKNSVKFDRLVTIDDMKYMIERNDIQVKTSQETLDAIKNLDTMGEKIHNSFVDLAKKVFRK